MPVPSQCQHFVDEIDALEGQLQEVGELPQSKKAEAIASNHQILQKIALLQHKLSECRSTAGAVPYTTKVDVFDMTPGGGTVTFPLSATLSNENRALESSPVKAGQLSFTHDPPPPTGSWYVIRVDEATNPTFPGPLFRSNAFPTAAGGSLPAGAPANPSGSIEIVIVGPVPIDPSKITLMPSDLPPISGLVVTGVTASLGQGLITVMIVGSVQLRPVKYTYVFGLAPSRSLTPSNIMDVVPVSGTLDFVTLFGRIFAFPLKGALEGLIFSQVGPQIQAAINDRIMMEAVKLLNRPLAANETISMRRVVVTSAGLSVFPTFSTYGHA